MISHGEPPAGSALVVRSTQPPIFLTIRSQSTLEFAMRIIFCASFGIYLAAAGAYSHAYARLVNTTIHSTHPQVRYTPESSCSRESQGKCTEEYDPFTMSTYVDGDSKKRTFFQTNSRGNKRDNKSMMRTVEIQFYGAGLLAHLFPRML